MKAALLISSLGRAGAEGQLVTLARGLAAEGHDVVVGVFYGGRELEEELRTLNIRVRHLRKRHRWDLTFFAQLYLFLADEKPDVVHSYMRVANLSVVPMRAFFPKLPFVWGIRDSKKDIIDYGTFGSVVTMAHHRLSGFPQLIIANSRAGRDHNIRHGAPPDRIIVIPNGVDTDRFRPDERARARLRAEWGIPDGDRVIGLVARLNPIKDHRTFIRAAATLAARRRDVRFVCVGDGPPELGEALTALAQDLGVSDRLVWVGRRADMPAVHAALDIACSTSISEGFSNSLAEAMACGVPCVATDVGDSAYLIGKTGIIVPPKDPNALAEAWNRMLSRLAVEGDQVRNEVRLRIVTEFGMAAAVQRTSAALETLLSAARGPS